MIDSWRKIKLSGMDVPRWSPYCSNQTCKATSLRLLLSSLFKKFKLPYYCWTIIILSLQSSKEAVPWSEALSLLILLLFITIKAIAHSRSSQTIARDHENREYKYWDGDAFSTVKSKDIKVGHILSLSSGETAPADLLVLTTYERDNDKGIVIQDIDGETVSKKPVEVTNEFCISVDLYKLRGYAKVHHPSRSFKKFIGKIQLTTDFKEHNININHFINTGSFLKATDLVLCLVVYTGKDTRLWTEPTCKFSMFEKRLNKAIGFLIIFYVFLTGVCLGLNIFFQQNHLFEFEYTDILEIAVYNFTLIPLNLLVFYEFVKLAGTITVRKRCESNDMIEELGSIDQVIVSDSAIDETYDVCIHQTSDENVNLNSREFSKELVQTIALSALVITQKDTFSSLSQEDIMIAEFARDLGCSIKARDSNYCVLLHDLDKTYYIVLGFKDYSPKSRHSTIIVLDKEKKCQMITKGRYKDIRDMLEPSQFYYPNGQKFLVVATKTLSFDEYMDFCALYEDAKLYHKNVENKKTEVFSKFEKNLQTLCILQIKMKVPENLRYALFYFHKAQIKTWFVSHLHTKNTIIKANKSGFLSPNLIKLKNLEHKGNLKESLLRHYHDFINESSCKLDLTNNRMPNNQDNHFFSISSHEENENSNNSVHESSFSILIDSSTFEEAIQNEDTKAMLVSLLFAADSACFLGFNPWQKAQIVKIVQKNISKNLSVMALGACLGDCLMLKQSNVGVSSIKGITDIYIQDLNNLMRLVLEDGYWVLYRVSFISLVFLYQAFLFLGINILFFVTSDYSASQLIENSCYYSLSWFIILPQVILIAFKDKKHSSKNIMKNLKHSRKNQFNPRNVLKYGIIGLSQGTVVWLFVFYGCPKIIREAGQTRDLEYVSTCVFLVLCLLVIFELYIMSSRTSPLSFVTVAIGIVLVFCTCLLLYYAQSAFINQVASVPLTFLIVLCAFLCCLLVRVALSLIFSSKNIAEYLNEKVAAGKVYNSCKDRDEKTKNPNGINPYTLKFYRYEQEQQYCKEYSSRYIKMFQMIYLFGLLSAFFLFVKNITYQDTGYLIAIQCLVLSVGFCVLFCLSLLKSMARRTILLAKVTMIIAIGLLAIRTQSYDSDLFMDSLFPTLSYQLTGTCWSILTIGNLFHLLIIFISAFNGEDIVSMVTILIYYVAITFTAGVVAYQIEKFNRTEYALTESINNLKERSASLLRTLLPNFVLRRVKDGTRYIAEEKGVVTILFCYICDFEFISADYSASDLSDFLNSLFNQFDLICQNSGATKIETVGNTYMACAGLQECEEFLDEDLSFMSQADRMIMVGGSILDVALRTKLKNGSHLKVKVGIHSGEVVAGVVGYHKPQFSLVGDPVNTASRLCSTASPESMQISDSTKELVTVYEGFEFIEHHVEAKGKGLLKTFIVQRSFTSTVQKENLPVCVFSLNSTISRKPTMIPHKTEDYSLSQFKSNFDGQSDARTVFHLQLIVFASYVLLGLISLANYNKLTFLMGIYAISCLMIMVLLKTIYKHSAYAFISILISLVPILYRIINYPDISEEFLVPEQILWLLFIIYGLGLDIKIIVPHSFVAMILIDIYYVYLHVIETWVIEGVVFMILLVILSIYSVHTIRNLRLNEFCLQAYDRKELEVSEQLLFNLMPKWVLDDLMHNREINDEIKEVTLLYADIVGFTAYSASKTPNEIIEMLSRLFTKFDKLCITHNVYKVYTIGDCYVVMSCVDKRNRNIPEECLNVVNMAIQMIQVIQDVNMEHRSELDMRIGIHTGNISGAITGSTIVRYDIYGLDAAIANKLESGGSAGRIKISNTTMDLLESYYKGKFQYEFDQTLYNSSARRSHDTFFLKYD